MAGKRRVFAKCALALLLVFTLVIAPVTATAPVAYAASLKDLQDKQNKLSQQQKENKAKLDKLKNDKAKQQEYKNALDAQIANVQDQINSYIDQINMLDGEITQKSQEIAGKQSDIDQDVETLKQRLCALYMTGEASTLEIVLNSKSVMELADKMEIMKAITNHDTKLIDGLKTEMKQIAAQKQEIEGKRQAASEAKTQMDVKKKELTVLEIEAERILGEISKNEKDAKSEQERLAKEKKKADAAIDKWLKDYAESQKNNSGGYTSTGNFTWPCPGYTKLTTRYGEVIYGQAHRGIDVAGSGIRGAKIVAADGGKVIKAGWNNSYGNCVYIDHGGGFITRYAHASKLAVKEGTIVKKGQTIAYVGNTGYSFGNHLHFEVIKNGSTKNPMSYFKK